MVEVVPAQETPPLDPSADPTTALGELRARYVPNWSSDFDWAFPPEACGSDWALDAIAEPTSGADLAVLGDPMAAAALSVLRFEYLLSRAFAEPEVLEQLCVAVATVGTTRSEALELLAIYLRSGTRSAEPAAYPDEVIIVAARPVSVLAVACVTPGYPAVVTAEGELLDDVSAPAGLLAYMLSVSRGLEDAVIDISYRVSNVVHQPAETCAELDRWAGQWELQAIEWAEQGELWGLVRRTVTIEELCTASSSDVEVECPRDWAP